MSIKYNILKINITTPPSYKAKVKEISTYNLKMISDAIINQGSTVTKADIVAVLTNLITVCKNALQMGTRINIEGLVQLYPTIEGTFEGVSDTFDKRRHKLNIGSRVSKELIKDLRSNAKLEKKITPLPSPAILQVIDHQSDTINSKLSNNSVVTLNGSKLKYDESRLDEGIYVINDSMQNEFKVMSNSISTATYKNIIFQTGTIGGLGDNCHIEVRSRMGNSLSYSLRVAKSVSIVLA